jgi:glycosyltransferase involved in cell wall biosynthesis
MPNGVDESISSAGVFDPTAKHRLGLHEYVVLGFTGFVREWNGLEVVLELLATPQGQGWFLLVVGDGPARSSLEFRARQLGVEARVRFTGLVRHTEVASMVSAFDIALQPAANPYASPLKLFEYMALKRAIVAPDQPNIREVLTNEEDALLFDPDDPSEFSAAIGRLSEDSGLRERLAVAGATTLRERDLSWRQNASRVLALAADLVERTVEDVDGARTRVGRAVASDALGKR